MIKHGNMDSNIFDIINELVSLSNTENPKSSVTEDRRFSDIGSIEDSYFRTSSMDYFRSSSLCSNNNHIKNQDDNYFNEEKLFSKNSFHPNDFSVKGLIGEGAYSKVIKVKHKKTGELFAVKLIDKTFMEKEDKLYQIYVENEILNMCDHNNIIKIYGAFEDEKEAYLAMEFCSNGDLSEFIKNYNPLNIEIAKFFMAQILLSIEYLASKNIIHRDIKPDNFVFSDGYQLKLVDFATAKIKGKIFDENEFTFVDEQIQVNDKNSLDNNLNNMKISKYEETGNKNTIKDCNTIELNGDDKIKHTSYPKQNFVGTAEFMAPEILNNQEVGIYTDLWAFGCIIYQCFMGHTPFIDKTQYLIFQNINNLNYKIDKKKVPEDAEDLIKNLLVLNPKGRLGSGLSENNTIQKLKSHKFFNNFNIKTYLDLLELYNKKNESKKEPLFEKKNQSKSERYISEDKGTDEKILKSGELKKKSRWLYYDKRKVVLYSTPRIDYIEPTTNILKGSIALTKECKAVLKNKTTFELVTANRNYIFICKKQYDITSWVIAINDAINNYNQ